MMEFSKPKYYITTPIYFPNGNLHIGHTYTTVAADTMARYKRKKGYDVFFLTGTDEHGQKIESAAATAGKSEIEFLDEIIANIKRLWELFGISYNKFIRTTEEYHQEAVKKIFTKLYEQGDIYKGSYSGYYCTPCETFFTKLQLNDENCPDCGRKVQVMSEESYFFRLSKYQDKLIKLYEDNPEFIQPVSRRNEMLNNFILPGLEDLAVSRTSFKWGVPVEFDKGHIVYVWVDALSNYITALGAFSDDTSLFDRYWPADVHLMAKEIVRFHAVIWPALLMALGLELPQRIFGHGWLLLDGGKMSKSKGNVIDPFILAEKYSVDALRYFLLRDLPFGLDGTFTEKALITRMNADLANDLGNLVSRTVAMVIKYFDGKLIDTHKSEDIDLQLEQCAKTAYESAEKLLDQMQFSTALAEIFKLVSRANKYIDETTPWILAKQEENQPRLACVLYNLLECIRISAQMLSPFIPGTSEKILGQIGAKDVWEQAGYFGVLPKQAEVIKGEVLFPRIEIKNEQ